ncbi:hypothetical protein FDP41_000286 [Naegleria fowleri]|uniref:4-coumarate--CoA ligase n=1 Tax=Naegleria fowleri TaxID=5763 RepID=A0A6A5C511_NAEFO|nr:uncharacterized protein FDP41_000286 [Naegleria fowleri]KAF0984387.1 hypothetical protein FDP41_000286 [Naegleria fowleri]
MIIQKCREHGDRVAMVDGTCSSSSAPFSSLTFSQMATLMITIGNNLVDLYQVEKGQVIAVLLPNMPLFPCIFHGVGYIGGICTTLNPLYSVEEMQSQLQDSNAIMMVTVQPLLEKALKSVEGSGVKKIFVLGLKDQEEQVGNDKCQVLDAKVLLKTPKSTEMIYDRKINPKEDLVVLPYSSGTTGLCKGVCLTHYNLVSNILQIGVELEPLTAEDVIIAVLPFFHIYGLTVLCNKALYEGAKAVTMAKFDLETFLKLIQEHKITRVHLAPPIILALAKHPIVDKYDLSSLRVILSGAAPLSGDVAKLVRDRLKLVVKQGYGLTESSPVLSVCGDTPERIKDGSAGLLLNHTVLKIVDTETGEEITEYGKAGELCFAGPQIMKGYLNNDEATNNTLKDGFLHTGDIGYIDQDDFIFIVDRLKELIKYNGHQVPPCELEGVLCKHPKILDAAVIGVPNEETGELPKAFVVLRQNENMTEEEVMNYVAEHVSPVRKVRLVEFVNEIPKSVSGKILRRILKARELEKLKKKQ